MSNSINESAYDRLEDSLPVKTTEVANSTLEKLLLEAQRESNKSSRVSSNIGSPKLETGTASPAFSNGATQPVNENLEQPNLEWVWDWSSRPEAQPIGTGQATFKHPIGRKSHLSIRNTRIMSNISHVMDSFPYFLFTHACSFLIGATVVALYMKKYNNPSIGA